MTPGSGSFRSDRVIWIFGSGRTGSTWLARMLGALPRFAVWDEPAIGALFGEFYYERFMHRRGKRVITAAQFEPLWLRSIENMVLEGATARFPEEASDGFVVVKEPHGTVGAPLLVKALPSSRVILLARDPRDVVASSIDAFSEGGWVRERRGDPYMAPDNDEFARARAQTYVWNMQSAAEAYVEHRGPKCVVRYEDLRTDALSTMRGIRDALRLSVEEASLVEAVSAEDWERVPEAEKGRGKQKRKAMPGSWREDLTPRQVEIVERIAAPVLEDLYREDRASLFPADRKAAQESPSLSLSAILESRDPPRQRTGRSRMLALKLEEARDRIEALEAQLHGIPTEGTAPRDR